MMDGYTSPAPRAVGSITSFPATLSPDPGLVWQVVAAMVRVQADGTAGSRQLAFAIRSGSTDYYKVMAGATQGASTTIEYLLGAGHPAETSISSVDTLMIPLASGIVIDDTMEFRVTDEASVGGSDLVAPRLVVIEARRIPKSVS